VGGVLTLANDNIGTGPRLQMLTKDTDANARRRHPLAAEILWLTLKVIW